MKALMTLTLMIFGMTLLAGPSRGAGDGHRKDMFKNMTPEQVFERVTVRKYLRLQDQLRLTKDEQAKLFPILKKYDKEAFKLLKPKMEQRKKMQAERKARRAEKMPQKRNYTEKLNRMQERMKTRVEMGQKMYELQSKKIKELKSAGLPDELIVKTLRFERRMMRHFKGNKGDKGQKGNRGKHNRKGKKGKRGNRF